MTQWVKQLTRENTLLDRSLRTIAYHKSIPVLGKARIAKCPVVGKGKITSWYYDQDNYSAQQEIIVSEVGDGKIRSFGPKVLELLERAYRWALEARNQTSFDFSTVLKKYNAYHAYARGAVVYGYWGEPHITQMLKNTLTEKILAKDLEHSLSVLSTPHYIHGPLSKLQKGSSSLEKRRATTLKGLHLNANEKELIEILAWFTLFYELGERVSGELYKTFLKQLRRFVPDRKEYANLHWYDPKSLENYFHGKKLPADEIKRRKRSYILEMKGATLHITSGTKARQRYNKEFNERQSELAEEIKGTIASKGKVKGIVRIVITKADQRKMRVGDILVSTMTTPSLITAVKKAAAIVTDEGGLTAHAAIVARELGVPCIVGTKIATKVFRDGDIVEVDANRGVVRKL